MSDVRAANDPVQPAPPRGILRRLLQLPAYLYRAHLGFLFGHRILMLVHRGRKTGLRRETVLEVVHYDADRHEAIVAAGWGRKTAWAYNVEAGLVEAVYIGREVFVPARRRLDVDEGERVLAEYERRNRFIAPVIRAVLSRLLGWRYDSSPAARRRAVEQLGLFAFRPRD